MEIKYSYLFNHKVIKYWNHESLAHKKNKNGANFSFAPPGKAEWFVVR